ncbi:MAG: RagB/SusD family protein [Ferruginibacter sp.]|nr:RagB/SusD family protein [Ferruginibacter sp.]
MKHISNKKAGLAAMLFTLSLSAILPACKKDFLDRDPQGQYTTDTYPYPAGAGPFDQYIFGGYAGMRVWGVAAFPFVGATSIRSDDADKGSTPADGPDQIQMDNFPVAPTNGLVNDMWKAYYDVIGRANDVLDRIAKDNSPTSAPFKAQAEGEAKFIRGYSYFMLVRLFGGVPKIDSVSATVQNKPRASVAEIYALIESDLQTAATSLPATWSTGFTGRATKGAANGLLAKVYLTQQKWGPAMSAASAVINSGVYDLSTPYTTIFREEGENSKESIFEIQAIANASNPSTETYGVQYTNVQGVRGSGAFDLGWGFNVPNSYLAAAYEPGDPRKERTFLREGETTYYGETLPMGLPNPAYNEKVYTNPSVRATVGNRFGWWMNVRILRYADVVLMYAEAANEIGGAANTTEALAKLEMVRNRARDGNAAILPAVTTTNQGALRTAIRQERRVELAMEHDRFFDLVRWGIAASTLQASGRPNFNGARDNILPIPQAQRDISNNVLSQNPNY